MITTHLVALSFFDGATGSAAVDGLDGYLPVGPYALLDGFSGSAAADGIDGYLTIGPYALLDGFSGSAAPTITVVTGSHALMGVGI